MTVLLEMKRKQIKAGLFLDFKTIRCQPFPEWRIPGKGFLGLIPTEYSWAVGFGVTCKNLVFADFITPGSLGSFWKHFSLLKHLIKEGVLVHERILKLCSFAARGTRIPRRVLSSQGINPKKFQLVQMGLLSSEPPHGFFNDLIHEAKKLDMPTDIWEKDLEVCHDCLKGTHCMDNQLLRSIFWEEMQK